LKDLEAIRPSAIIDIIQSGEAFEIKTETKMPTQTTCEKCGYISSNQFCKACVLLEGLNKGVPKLGVGKTKTLRKKYEAEGLLDANSSPSSSSSAAPDADHQ
jgi:cytoplasmic tRNA 2-thiolation protein 1